MTVMVHIGRRVPKNWARRVAQKAKGLVSFQENLWLIIKQSLSMAKKKANQANELRFVMTTDKENEDLNYQIEWLKVIIQGTKEQEKEEYDEAMALYKNFAKLLNKEIPKDNNMKKHLKTKILSPVKVEEAYNKGYGAVSDKNIANKLLEMGIVTHVELIDDYDSKDRIPG